MILFDLDTNKKLIDVLNDLFRFIGIGFGGNILLYYCKFIIKILYLKYIFLYSVYLNYLINGLFLFKL